MLSNSAKLPRTTRSAHFPREWCRHEWSSMGWWGPGSLFSTTAWGGGLLFKPCWWRGSTAGFNAWYACWTVSELHLIQSDFTDILSSKRKDYRTRRDRIERQVQAWKLLLPHLVTAFLKFQRRGAPDVNEDDGNPWGIEVISLEGRFKFPFLPRQALTSWQVEVFGPFHTCPMQCLLPSPLSNMGLYQPHPNSRNLGLPLEH